MNLIAQVADPTTTRIELGPIRQCRRTIQPRSMRRCLLTPAEVALLWHPPTESVQAVALANLTFRELPPPVDLPELHDHPDLAVLGVTAFRGEHRRCGPPSRLSGQR